MLLERFHILSSLRNLMKRMNFKIITSLICYIKFHYYIVTQFSSIFVIEINKLFEIISKFNTELCL